MAKATALKRTIVCSRERRLKPPVKSKTPTLTSKQDLTNGYLPTFELDLSSKLGVLLVFVF